MLAHTSQKMSDPEIETSSSEAITFEDVERQIRAVTDPLTQQVAQLCELMKELRDAHTHIGHEETASPKATSSSTGGTNWSDNNYYSSRVVSRADGGWRSLCIKKGYSEPTRAESREGTSTRAESSRVTYYSILTG